MLQKFIDTEKKIVSESISLFDYNYVKLIPSA